MQWLALLVTLGCAAAPAPVDRCALDPSPEIIAVEDPIPGELHEIHDLPDSPALFAPRAWPSYRERAAARVDDLDARALLRRQLEVFGRTPGDLDAANLTHVIDGTGSIEPASCLETLLLERQSARFDILDHPTEFGAFVLRGHGRVRVYFSGADRVGQRMRSEVTDRVAADLARGFTLVTHIHNHTFLFDRAIGDRMWTTEATIDDIGGGVAPSATDVQLYRGFHTEHGLPEAWITNGIDSGRFDAADFDALESR